MPHRKAILDLRSGDRFLYEDPLSTEFDVLTVVGGPVNHFGSVTVEVAEWDFDFEAISSDTVRLVSDPPG